MDTSDQHVRDIVATIVQSAIMAGQSLQQAIAKARGDAFSNVTDLKPEDRDIHNSRGGYVTSDHAGSLSVRSTHGATTTQDSS